jgi:nitrosocyanin
MNKSILAVIIGVVVIGGGFMLYRNSPMSTTTPQSASITDGTTPASPEVPASEPTNAGQVKEFSVSGGEFYYEPSTLAVKKGDKVRIIFKNTDGFHDFRIDELGVATKKINDGQSDTVEFTADKVGSFEYYCSVGKHRQMGMKGTLTVGE